MSKSSEGNTTSAYTFSDSPWSTQMAKSDTNEIQIVKFGPQKMNIFVKQTTLDDTFVQWIPVMVEHWITTVVIIICTSATKTWGWENLIGNTYSSTFARANQAKMPYVKEIMRRKFFFMKGDLEYKWNPSS